MTFPLGATNIVGQRPGIAAGGAEAIAAAAGLAEGLTRDAAAVEHALEYAPGLRSSRSEEAPYVTPHGLQASGQTRPVERHDVRPLLMLKLRKLPGNRLGPVLLHGQFGKERFSSPALLHGVEEVPDAGDDHVPLAQQGRPPVRGLFPALLHAVEGLGDRPGDEPLVERPGQGIEKRRVQAICRITTSLVQTACPRFWW